MKTTFDEIVIRVNYRVCIYLDIRDNVQEVDISKYVINCAAVLALEVCIRLAKIPDKRFFLNCMAFKH
jgi:hypothetical protein